MSEKRPAKPYETPSIHSVSAVDVLNQLGPARAQVYGNQDDPCGDCGWMFDDEFFD